MITSDAGKKRGDTMGTPQHHEYAGNEHLRALRRRLTINKGDPSVSLVLLFR